MQFTYDKKLEPLLAEIEELLVSSTPRDVANLKVAEPVYAVFLWYDDSSAVDGFAPSFGLGVESVRTACSTRYKARESVNDCIWRPQQIVPELVPRGNFQNRTFISKCNTAYALMDTANESGLPLEDEGELLHPFRSMMHRVANRLNKHAWKDVLATTEDFVVVSLDRIGYWLSEDLKKSMPAAKYKLLKQGQLLFDVE